MAPLARRRYSVLVRIWAFGLGSLLASGFTNRSENTYHLQMCARLPRSVQPEIALYKCNMLHGNKRAAKPSVLLYAIVLIVTSVSSGSDVVKGGASEAIALHKCTDSRQLIEWKHLPERRLRFQQAGKTKNQNDTTKEGFSIFTFQSLNQFPL